MCKFSSKSGGGGVPFQISFFLGDLTRNDPQIESVAISNPNTATARREAVNVEPQYVAHDNEYQHYYHHSSSSTMMNSMMKTIMRTNHMTQRLMTHTTLNPALGLVLLSNIRQWTRRDGKTLWVNLATLRHADSVNPSTIG